MFCSVFTGTASGHTGSHRNTPVRLTRLARRVSVEHTFEIDGLEEVGLSTTLVSRVSSARCAPPARLSSSLGAETVTLLGEADRCLAEAERERDPTRRFTAAYLSALRAAAAVLVVHGRPHRARHRPASVWVLLENAAPDLAGWAGCFAARSSTHAAAQAGRSDRVTHAGAEELVAQARRFLLVVRDVAIRVGRES